MEVTRAKAIYGVGEVQVMVELKSCKTEIRSVDGTQHSQAEEHGQQMPIDPADY